MKEGGGIYHFFLSSITDPGVKDDDELANFPKLPVDVLESDR